MKIALVLMVLTYSTFSLAATPEEENGMLTYVFDTFDYVSEFFHHAPTMLESFFAYVIEYCVMISLKLKLEALEFSYGVAVSMLQNLSFDSLLNDAFSGLSAEHRNIIGAYGIGAGITRIVEAMTTRFVMDFMGM
ncbi:DUF2523 domain-containing protein [Vibrio sp. ZSDZ65]|uniref:DUF2523 domain-containing protein n=1 Tax=Vibrio qingdaonensis TaxID=2829491 RepID=A0A9X3CM90_9VIBR|nr:DUF2523 family protein [Vibrio qingdaonensis]MCW8345978.1 DUF2523 domain-containing protein [Vibrio qingdaonensis]